MRQPPREPSSKRPWMHIDWATLPACRCLCWKPPRKAISPTPSGTCWRTTGANRPSPTPRPRYTVPAARSPGSDPVVASLHLPAHPHYRLADYLEQHGRTDRDTSRVPAVLWEAFIEHHASRDCRTLARAARDRGLLRIAMRFYAIAVHASDNDALKEAAWLLVRQGGGRKRSEPPRSSHATPP